MSGTLDWETPSSPTSGAKVAQSRIVTHTDTTATRIIFSHKGRDKRLFSFAHETFNQALTPIGEWLGTMMPWRFL